MKSRVQNEVAARINSWRACCHMYVKHNPSFLVLLPLLQKPRSINIFQRNKARKLLLGSKKPMKNSLFRPHRFCKFLMRQNDKNQRSKIKNVVFCPTALWQFPPADPCTTTLLLCIGRQEWVTKCFDP